MKFSSNSTPINPLVYFQLLTYCFFLYIVLSPICLFASTTLHSLHQDENQLIKKKIDFSLRVFSSFFFYRTFSPLFAVVLYILLLSIFFFKIKYIDTYTQVRRRDICSGEGFSPSCVLFSSRLITCDHLFSLFYTHTHTHRHRLDGACIHSLIYYLKRGKKKKKKKFEFFNG